MTVKEIKVLKKFGCLPNWLSQNWSASVGIAPDTGLDGYLNNSSLARSLALGLFFLGTLALIGLRDHETRGVIVAGPLYGLAMLLYLMVCRCQFAFDIERLAEALGCHIRYIIGADYKAAESWARQVLVNYAALFLYAEKELGLQDPRLEKVFKEDFRKRHEIFLKFKLCSTKWNEYFNEAKEAKNSSPPGHLMSIVDKMKA